MPDEVAEAEGACLRAADGGAGELVDRRDGEIELVGELVDLGHRVDPDAVGDEGGRVLRHHGLLPEHALAEVHEEVEDRRVGVWPGDDLEEAHVAHGIEEVRPAEVLSEVLASSLGHLRDGDAGGVGRDEGTGLPRGIYALEEGLLDVEPLHDHLDDPVDVLYLVEVVVEVAGRDPFRESGIVEGGGFCLERRFEALVGEAVATGAVVFFVFGQVARDDVEEEDFEPDVGEVAGDAGAHEAGAEDGAAAEVTRHREWGD